jgi:hypothetical protein
MHNTTAWIQHILTRARAHTHTKTHTHTRIVLEGVDAGEEGRRQIERHEDRRLYTKSKRAQETDADLHARTAALVTSWPCWSHPKPASMNSTRFMPGNFLATDSLWCTCVCVCVHVWLVYQYEKHLAHIHTSVLFLKLLCLCIAAARSRIWYGEVDF